MRKSGGVGSAELPRLQRCEQWGQIAGQVKICFAKFVASNPCCLIWLSQTVRLWPTLQCIDAQCPWAGECSGRWSRTRSRGRLRFWQEATAEGDQIVKLSNCQIVIWLNLVSNWWGGYTSGKWKSFPQQCGLQWCKACSVRLPTSTYLKFGKSAHLCVPKNGTVGAENSDWDHFYKPKIPQKSWNCLWF